MEGIIFEGVSTDVAIATFIFLGAVVTGVLLAWMNEEEATGASLTWAEWPLPATEISAPAEEERLRPAA